MPDVLHLKLKEHLAAACHALKVAFSDFARLTDLNQFLLDAADIKCSRSFAAKALAELKSDATGMAKYVPSVAVLSLLDQAFGVPAEDISRERRLKDLKQLVDADENEQAFRELIDAWYN